MTAEEFTARQTLLWGNLFRFLNYQIYEGTVPHYVKARRRAAGKVAKRSRKINRGRR